MLPRSLSISSVLFRMVLTKVVLSAAVGGDAFPCAACKRTANCIRHVTVIVCTGSSDDTIKPKPQTGGSVVLQKQSRLQQLVLQAREISSARSYIIVGGGLVGVELAAELHNKQPPKTCAMSNKVVTIVARGNPLVSTLPVRAQQYITQFLLSRNVQIAYNTSVDNGIPVSVRVQHAARGGAEPLVLTCAGSSHQSTAALISGVCELPTSPSIANTLQIEGTQNIFGAGDAALALGLSNSIRFGSVRFANHSACLAADNMKHQSQGTQGHALEIDRKHSYPALCLSLGGSDGIVVVGNRVVATGRLASFTKQLIEWVVVHQLQGNPIAGVLAPFFSLVGSPY